MRLRLSTTIVTGVLVIGGLLAATSLAQAGGCCGGGSYRRFASRATYSAPKAPAGSLCQMGGMSMSGMNMAAPGATPQIEMARMTMAVPAPVAATAASDFYYPMHPTVVSAGPATCPYCQMTLKNRYDEKPVGPR